MPAVLWWGRFDPGYSRNRIVMQLFADLGWQVRRFSPAASFLGGVEAGLRRLLRPDLVWVPAFRHTDIASASRWARRWAGPLVIDPLISAYQKQVFEREKFKPGSRTAEHRRAWESALFSRADRVVADTPAHGRYFVEQLGVSESRVSTLYVGAETELFFPRPAPAPKPPFEVLFYGSFLELQGPEVIAEAAAMTRDPEISWVLMGKGRAKEALQKRYRQPNLVFEPWVDYRVLPRRLARAHILLGVFGSTPKAQLVIPNKLFQATAMGKPVITRRAEAYEAALAGSDAIGWVSAGNPGALASMVRSWLQAPDQLAGRGAGSREWFDRYFGPGRLKAQLEALLGETGI